MSVGRGQPRKNAGEPVGLVGQGVPDSSASPALVLAAVRRGLDVAAQQATAAKIGDAWWSDDPYGALVRLLGRLNDEDEAQADATHIAAWSPSHVLAHVGSLRTICDGIEATLERHAPHPLFWLGSSCKQCRRSLPCEDQVAALSSLAGLAAVWAPTEQETP